MQVDHGKAAAGLTIIAVGIVVAFTLLDRGPTPDYVTWFWVLAASFGIGGGAVVVYS